MAEIGSALVAEIGLLYITAYITPQFIEFIIGSEIYYTNKEEKNNTTRGEMDTKAVIEQNRTYVPVRYVAEAFGAQVNWDESTRTVTITSETKVVGDFIVPKSYTDDAEKFKFEELTEFHIDIPETLYGGTGINNRIQITLNILSQKLGQDAIARLNELIKGDKAYGSKDEYGHDFDNIFDSKSGQYVQLKKFPRYYRIRVYDRGIPPQR